MDQDGAYPGNFRRLDRPQHSVAQKPDADSLPLECSVDGEPGQYHHRNGIGHISLHSSHGFLMRDSPDSQRVKADHSQTRAHDVRPRSTACIIL